MDIRTLPDNERQIYNRIKGSYKLSFDSVRINENNIRLLKIADLEEFLAGKDPFADVSDFPFWVKLWESAIVLAYVLDSLPEKKSKSLLELGAGLGLPGITAASAGFDVTLSDYEDIILDFQRVSCAASKLANVSIENIDWLRPPKLGKFDILAGAEILFREEFFEPLLKIFKEYLKPEGLVYMAHSAERKSLPKFLKIAANDFDISISKQTMKKPDGNVEIIVNCLRPKK